jgi:hypothetical protein
MATGGAGGAVGSHEWVHTAAAVGARAGVLAGRAAGTDALALGVRVLAAASRCRAIGVGLAARAAASGSRCRGARPGGRVGVGEPTDVVVRAGRGALHGLALPRQGGRARGAVGRARAGMERPRRAVRAAALDRFTDVFYVGPPCAGLAVRHALAVLFRGLTGLADGLALKELRYA